MYYFIGIKGTGMAALACILSDLGHEVIGCDLEKHFFTQDELDNRGIKILPFNKNNIIDNSVVIVGNAFLEDFEEVVAARNNSSVTVYRYHEFLGEFMKDYTSFCVAGSHGKTTTTGMLSAMINYIEPCGYLIGDGSGKVSKDCKNFVVEACEYRRHFLAYKPDYAIITNIEIDHVDYFKSEEDYNLAFIEFSKQVRNSVVCFGDDENVRKIKNEINMITYGINADNNYVATNIVESSNHMEFDVIANNVNVGHFNLPFVGRHLLWNALGVITIGLLRNFKIKDIEAGLASFGGVKRRFVIEKYGDNIFVDDYAHHPTEVLITINAAKKRFPDKKIVAIFKPHRVSRVYYFAKEFAQALKCADMVYLCDFTSIDDLEDGIDIDITYLQNLIEGSNILSEDEKGAAILAKQTPAVYLFMSSKDIYGLANIVKRYQ